MTLSLFLFPTDVELVVAVQACKASPLDVRNRRCDKSSNRLIPEFHLHKKRNDHASGNTKYKVCTYVPKKAVFLPEEGIATSSSMPR